MYHVDWSTGSCAVMTGLLTVCALNSLQYLLNDRVEIGCNWWYVMLLKVYRYCNHFYIIDP